MILFLLIIPTIHALPKPGEELYYNDGPIGIPTHLTDEDFERGRYIYSHRFTRSVNNVLSRESTQKHPPMQNKNYFEGDIRYIGSSRVHPHDKLDTINITSNGIKKHSIFRNAIKEGPGSDYYKWPTPQIAYLVDSTYSSYSRSRIAAALKEYGKRSCIQFVPRTCQKDYVSIKPIDGCFSDVGKVGGKQEISLEAGCFGKGTILHELMHTVGFFHEQSRTDRDSYVTINWKNIEKGFEDQFQKYEAFEINNQGIPYDYSSIMHYSSTAFGKTDSVTGEDLETITPKKSGAKIGQRNDFSSIDVSEIKLLYNCANAGVAASATSAPQCTGGNYVDSCQDKRTDCPFLAKYIHEASQGQRYCDWQRAFMQQNCAKSCNLCQNSPSKPINTCVDKYPDCPSWGKALCTNSGFTLFMTTSCKRTCNIC